MENKEGILDVFVMLAITGLSIWVGHAGVLGLMRGEILAIVPFVLGSCSAAYFVVLALRTGFALLEDQPADEVHVEHARGLAYYQEYGDDGHTEAPRQ